MILLSVIVYIGIAAWYLLGNDKSQRISSVVGTCLSSFFAYWFWGENDIAMIIYVVMGLICVFFHWISIDVKNANLQVKSKNKTVAAVLALFLGGYGIHRFYLRKSTSALLYVLFSWSMIPGIIGIIEAVRFFSMKQERFDELYNGKAMTKLDQPTYTTPTPSAYRSPTTTPPAEQAHSRATVSQKEPDDVNEINYDNITSPAGVAKAKGTLETFTVSVYRNNSRYEFRVVDGQLVSFKSPQMKETRNYEGVG